MALDSEEQSFIRGDVATVAFLTVGAAALITDHVLAVDGRQTAV